MQSPSLGGDITACTPRKMTTLDVERMNLAKLHADPEELEADRNVIVHDSADLSMEKKLSQVTLDERLTEDTPTPSLTLSELVLSIAEALQDPNYDQTNPKHVAYVKRLMESYDSSVCDWKRYCFVDECKNYTRNLIATDNETFTLMLLCWNPKKARYSYCRCTVSSSRRSLTVLWRSEQSNPCPCWVQLLDANRRRKLSRDSVRLAEGRSAAGATGRKRCVCGGLCVHMWYGSVLETMRMEGCCCCPFG